MSRPVFRPWQGADDTRRGSAEWAGLLNNYVVLGTKTVTAGYTASIKDHTIRADATAGNVAITLPAAASCLAKVWTVKKVDNSANLVTIAATEAIDDAATATINTQYGSISVQSNGATFDIVAVVGNVGW